MDGSEATSGHHDDAEIDVASLALGWVCLILTSAVLPEGRITGWIDISWVTVSIPVCLPCAIALAYAFVAAVQDIKAVRR